MSEVRVNNIVDYGGKGAPTFDNGAVISGVSSLGNQAKIGSNVTITSGGINVSGVTTAATLSGNLTGDVSAGFLTATSTVIGSGVTINAGGLNITGVCTATTFEGDGSTMTGVAMTITPLVYNPDVNDTQVTKETGIGITFDHRIIAGSGNVTLSIATNAGAAGTTVENFGVGSSVTIQGRKATITPSRNLNGGETYHLSYPSGAFTNTGGDVSYVGTAYTFGVKPYFSTLWSWGYGSRGANANNTSADRSSPVQIGSESNWNKGGKGILGGIMTKTDGTMWSWGYNGKGQLGVNSSGFPSQRSSPIQIPGTTWDDVKLGPQYAFATRTDGTLWSWGKNVYGELGLNQAGSPTTISSPTQIPGTTWTFGAALNGDRGGLGLKTDGTLWVWGANDYGTLGLNQASPVRISSPTQLPGTTWTNKIGNGNGSNNAHAIKTDGSGSRGELAQNNRVDYSSPVQIPGTWKHVSSSSYAAIGVKTDGTLWAWGYNGGGQLAQNYTSPNKLSSPVQIPGTTWNTTTALGPRSLGATKTDGTLWTWGERNNKGDLGLNDVAARSSPTQVPGTTWDTDGVVVHGAGSGYQGGLIKKTT